MIQRKFRMLCHTESDINEHLPTLSVYASECESVLELGVRGCVSSWAFANGLLNNDSAKKQLILNDINEYDISELIKSNDNQIEIHYAWCNDLDLIMPFSVDLTFIDTWHVYGQLKRELDKFAPITNKYIIMHDTTVDERYGESIRLHWDMVQQSINTGIPKEEIGRGLGPAIKEFLANNLDWTLHKKFENNNGLTIL